MSRAFGSFDLLERIGIGAMSEVFLARRAVPLADAPDRIALKRLYPSADADWVAAIRDEAELVSRLDHPAIVRVLGSGVADGSLFVEYELVDGRDLAEVLDRARATNQKPPLAVVMSIALPILRGLAYVHAASNGAGKALVHRDVAPSNILVGFDGGAKLTDFGIAHEAGRTTRRTQEGLVKGTARYLSPEQARGEDLDATSDLFSFGCVLAEMLVGAPLHAAGGQAALFAVAEAGVDLRALEPHAPPKLRAILFKLLAQSRDGRYHRGEQCIEELEDFCRRTKVHVGPSTVAEFMANLFAPSSRQQRAGTTRIPETLPASSDKGSAPIAGRSSKPQHSGGAPGPPATNLEESLTMADEKGGSDLDVFEGLAKKSNRSQASAVPPPPGPPSKRATTLLGVTPPSLSPKVDVPPPPSVSPGSKAPPPPPPGGRASAPPAPPPASMRSPTATPIPAPPMSGPTSSKAPPPPPAKSVSAPPPPPPKPTGSNPPPAPPLKGGGTLMMDGNQAAAAGINATMPMDESAPAKPPPPPTTLVAAVPPPAQPPPSIGAALGIPSGPESTDEATPTHGKKGSKKRGAKVDMDWEDDEESTHVFEQKQHALPKPSTPKKNDAARVDAKSAALLAGSGASAKPISALPPPPAMPAPLPIPAPTMPKMVAADPVPSRTVAMEDRPTPLPMAPRQQASSSGRTAIILGALALAAVVGLAVYILVGKSAPSTGALRIEVKSKAGASIAKAEISIDGVKKCDATPCVATDLKPGNKSVTVVIAGSVNGTNQTAVVDAGKENFVSVTVDDALPVPTTPPTTPTTPPTTPEPAKKGTGIIVAGPSGMKIFVDGKEQGATSSGPLTLGTLTPGKHEIKIDGGKDYEAVTKSVEVKQDVLTDLGEIKLKVLMGHLKIDLKTAGAKVVLKSKGKPDKPITDEILKSDLAINIDPKQSWTILATKAGFDDFTQDITFDDGAADKTLAIELNEKGNPPVNNPLPNPSSTPPVMSSTKPENPPPDAMGTIAIGSIPPANALVDGAPAGKTPTSKKVAPGSHTVVFIFPSGSRKSVSVTVKAGETKSASARDN